MLKEIRFTALVVSVGNVKLVSKKVKNVSIFLSRSHFKTRFVNDIPKEK
jgi:hypothetical protein